MYRKYEISTPICVCVCFHSCNKNGVVVKWYGKKYGSFQCAQGMRMTKLKQSQYYEHQTFWSIFFFFFHRSIQYTQYSRDENTTFFLQTTLTEMESLLWPSFNLTSSLIAIMELYYTLFSSVALSLSFPCSEFRFCQFTTENGSMNLRWKVPLVIFDKKFLVSSHTFVRWFCVLGVCV